MASRTKDHCENFKKLQILDNKNYVQICNEIKTGKLSKDIKVEVRVDYYHFFRNFGFTKIKWKRRKIITVSLPILHVAIGLDDQEMVDYLLAQGVDLHAVSGFPDELQPALQFAVTSEKLTSIRKLLDAGVDVNDHGMKYTLPLATAMGYQEPKIEVAEYLIKRGAHINVEKCPLANGPMCAACNEVKKLEFLMSHGGDVNLLVSGIDGIWSTTPLISACSGNSPDSVVFLLNLPNIDVNKIDRMNRNCLHAATGMLEPRAFELLLSSNIDVNKKNMFQQLPTITKPLDQYDHFDMINRHLVKLMVAGFYVCEENRQAVAGREFDNFRAECAKELNLMKDTKDSYSSWSCFKIFFIAQHLLALRYKHVEVPTEQEEVWIKKFPIYGKMLAFHIKKALQRKMLLKRVDHVLFDIFYRVLPATFINELYHYFKIYELPKLFQ